MENTEKLQLLNQFTRRELTEEEVYIFDVILCDNEIDRDFEKFSLSALKTLQELFIGKPVYLITTPKAPVRLQEYFIPSLPRIVREKLLQAKTMYALRAALIW